LATTKPKNKNKKAKEGNVTAEDAAFVRNYLGISCEKCGREEQKCYGCEAIPESQLAAQLMAFSDCNQRSRLVAILKLRSGITGVLRPRVCHNPNGSMHKGNTLAALVDFKGASLALLEYIGPPTDFAMFLLGPFMMDPPRCRAIGIPGRSATTGVFVSELKDVVEEAAGESIAARAITEMSGL